MKKQTTTAVIITRLIGTVSFLAILLLAIHMMPAMGPREIAKKTTTQAGPAAAQSLIDHMKSPQGRSEVSEKPSSGAIAPAAPSILAPSPEPPANCNWVSDTVIPTNILDQAMAGLGSNIYTFAGVGNGVIIANSFKYDGTTWTPIASYPVATEYPCAAASGSFIYIMNGVSTGPIYQTTVYRYDPVANTFTPMAPNTVGVWNASVVEGGNNKLYKFGGVDSAAVYRADLEIYDIATNTWTPGAPMPTGKGFMAAWREGNFIYAAGGIGAGVGTNTAFRYDIAGNSWSGIANLPATRWGAASAFYGDSGVAAGGYVGGDAASNVSASAIYYNSAGNAWVSIPDMVTARARMGGAVRGGSFYVVGGRLVNDTGFTGSNNNQKLTCAFAPIVITAAGSSLQTEGCSPPNMVIDPGETVTVSFCAQNVGTTNTIDLMGTLQATGGVTNPSGPADYGVVMAGGAAVCRSFTFTADSALQCGGTLTATIHFQDGATDLGDQTYTFTVGLLQVNTAFSENFDTVVPPALPAGWSADQGINTAGAPPWVTSNSGVPAPVSDTAPNATFSQDPANLCDNRIYTPVLMYTAGAQLMFRQNYDLEQSSATVAYDAGVLEMSVNGGAYMDILAAGGTFASGGYNHTSLSTGFNNPLLADHCPGGACGNWSGISSGGAGGFETCAVNLPAAGVGMPVRFRWRMGSDNSVSHNGWRVDTVKITNSQYVCCSSAPTVSTAVSRKAHGALNFDVDLPLAGTPGIECRSGGATNDYTMVVTFTGGVTVSGNPQAEITVGMGHIGSGGVSNGGMVTVNGNMVTVPLTNVANAQTINVRLNGVNSASNIDAPADNVAIAMSRLLGDTNGNGTVNASDASQTKSRIGQVVGAANFRSDVNANGTINATDTALIKSNIGTGLP